MEAMTPFSYMLNTMAGDNFATPEIRESLAM